MPMGSISGRGTGCGLTGYATDWNAAYGGKPVVPSPSGSASSAISSNLGNLGSLYNLAGQVNPFQEQQLLNQYNAAIPGYGDLTKTAAGNVGQQLAGQVPTDVVNQLIQNASERGILTGSIDSPNANAALLRSLGLTSLGMQQSGLQNLLSMTQAAPIAAPYDISRMFITPEQVQQAQLAANIYASAPDPTAAANAAMSAARAGGSTGPTGPITLGPANMGNLNMGLKPTQDAVLSTPIYGSLASDITRVGGVDPYDIWNNWAKGTPTATFGGGLTGSDTTSTGTSGYQFPYYGYDYASDLFGPAPSGNYDYSMPTFGGTDYASQIFGSAPSFDTSYSDSYY